MRWDFGSVYKAIRQSKNLSQAKVCQDVISRANLSRIESNQVMPSIETMDFLLKQVNMDFDEFRYISHQYKYSEREAILLAFKNNLSVVSTKEFKKLRKRCQDYLKTHSYDIPIKSILRNLDITILIREEGPSQQAQSMAALVWQELEQYDNWYKSDLEILSRTLFYIPLTSLLDITDKIIERLQEYRDYTEIRPIKFALLANLSTIFLRNNYLKECQKVSVLLLELAKQTKRFDQLGFAQVRVGICRQDETIIIRGLKLLELTEENNKRDMLIYEIKKFYREDFLDDMNGSTEKNDVLAP